MIYTWIRSRLLGVTLRLENGLLLVLELLTSVVTASFHLLLELDTSFGQFSRKKRGRLYLTTLNSKREEIHT